MATVFEALQNAKYNLIEPYAITVTIAREQVYNAVSLLEKGYDLNTEIEPLLEKYDTIDNVPEKKSEG